MGRPREIGGSESAIDGNTVDISAGESREQAIRWLPHWIYFFARGSYRPPRGIDCLPAARLDRVVYKPGVLPHLVISSSQPRTHAAGALDYLHASNRRINRRVYGEVRFRENQEPWNSRSDGGCSCFAEPDRGQGCNSKAALRSHRDWYRRAIRRGGADYPDRRRVWVAGGTICFDDRRRAKGPSCRWRGRRMAATFNTPSAGVILAIEL